MVCLDRHDWASEWQQLEQGESVERGDLDSAAATLRALYEHLTSERPAP
jgi:hypothetical protein